MPYRIELKHLGGCGAGDYFDSSGARSLAIPTEFKQVRAGEKLNAKWRMASNCAVN